MICDFYDSTLEFQENLLVKYYLKKNHDVVVITSTYNNVFDYYADRHNNQIKMSITFDNTAKIIRLRYLFNFFNRLRAYTSIKKILTKESPDLIFVHDIMLNIIECVNYIKRNPNCKMILDYHADYSNSGKNWISIKILHGIIRKFFLDYAMPYITKIFPVVPASFKFLNEIYKVNEEKMEVLPLGADFDYINEVKSKLNREIFRKNLGVTNADFLIFTGGKIDSKKQTHLLIKALELINDKRIKLIVIGKATIGNEEYYNNLKQNSISNSNIIFSGWLNKFEIYSTILASDIAVFPASQSILWQTAIACGLPLICGDIGNQDISYLNKGNIEIIKSEYINSEIISNLIQEIFYDYEKFKKMQYSALQVGEKLLDWNNLINKTLY
jgi:1,2-diacylglycerol 3-alpha-glucosyltransferase